MGSDAEKLAQGVLLLVDELRNSPGLKQDRRIFERLEKLAQGFVPGQKLVGVESRKTRCHHCGGSGSFVTEPLWSETLRDDHSPGSPHVLRCETCRGTGAVDA
jgi:DnaJ-class molecular chaperone